ncbi:hypothetical protein [Paracoccus siganidrum]|uniref:hypothetical protein n=1 Tax=Paracoccus siganidrum TaxID=1276757 RepID=UPI0014729E6E|nr:hypothetical protein [Paracoccus siganidrum]
MSPDQFRLVLAICAIVAVLGYLASIDAVLAGFVVILVLLAAFLWLCWRLIQWTWRNRG